MVTPIEYSTEYSVTVLVLNSSSYYNYYTIYYSINFNNTHCSLPFADLSIFKGLRKVYR